MLRAPRIIQRFCSKPNYSDFVFWRERGLWVEMNIPDPSGNSLLYMLPAKATISELNDTQMFKGLTIVPPKNVEEALSLTKILRT